MFGTPNEKPDGAFVANVLGTPNEQLDGAFVTDVLDIPNEKLDGVFVDIGIPNGELVNDVLELYGRFGIQCNCCNCVCGSVFGYGSDVSRKYLVQSLSIDIKFDLTC